MKKLSVKTQDSNNKLIAEFMGFEKVKIGYTATDSETEWQRNNLELIHILELFYVGEYIVNATTWKRYDWKDVKYHSSWEWLMPVVEKIETINHSHVDIKQNTCTVVSEFKVISNTHDSKIEATYGAVVEFIKYYQSVKK